MKKKGYLLVNNFFFCYNEYGDVMNIIDRIHDYALEEIMETRFSRYSKSIIQERALPDVRDGLKPVQRRILYAMYKENHTYDHPYVKSARSVGDIMGKYHPHGDSSIYEAMVRMSQWWKQNTPYIDMQGNNGSMDGDGAAAMRYTESRLSKITNELLKDINKDTVTFVPNFDDSRLEPTVLPAKFPNLLVNGATGISAGYATNIPTHNLGEVIDATIKRIDNPNCRLETILEIIQGPDFPTGAIIEGKSGIEEAYRTGRGRIIVRAKTEFVKEKGKEQIVISQIPFDVNKATLVKKIDDIRIDKKIEGIAEVRDESDREDPMRIVVDLKKDANRELVLNYLFKNTELQISYNFNMVAIVNRRPMTIGVLPMLDAYIDHQREVITRRTEFDLATAKKEMHLTEGLMKALSILDEVIRTIRASKNKADAEANLVKEYDFTEEQARAIVLLQLYRLTNFDIVELEEKYKNLAMIIQGLEAILADPEKLKGVMKEELRKIKKDYAIPRKTEIRDEIMEIKIETTHLIPKEDVIVVVTKEGYVKRVSLRSYDETSETILKEGDYVIGKYKLSTLDTVLIFTNLGNFLYVPVYEIPDLKWKELGKHISNVIKISAEEMVVGSIPVTNFQEELYITTFSKNGMVKRSLLSEFKLQRYTKPVTAMKLKENDQIVSVSTSSKQEVFVVTLNGYGLRYSVEEVPVTGLKSGGVKAITLKNDEVVCGHLIDQTEEYLIVVTHNGTAKRVKFSEIEAISRGRKGVQIIREVKTNPYYILNVLPGSSKSHIVYKTKEDMLTLKASELPIMDRYGTGTSISKQPILDVFEPVKLEESNGTSEKIESPEKVEKNIDLKSIDDKMMTINDFLDDFNV